VVIASLTPLGELILQATGAQGVVPTNEAIVSIAAAEFGAQVAWVMIGGFAVNLLIARITPLKYVFLTGHHMFFMATMLTVVLATDQMHPALLIAVGSLLLGTIMCVMPALLQPYTKRSPATTSWPSGTSAASGTWSQAWRARPPAASRAPPKT